MKNPSIFNFILGGAIAIASFALPHAGMAGESRAERLPRYRYSRPVNQEFFCGRSDDGVPTTFVKTRRGTFRVIRWVSHVFNQAGYVPETRCRQVSSKFQQFYERGLLNYVTTGIVNRQPVICVSDAKDGPCLGVLFTLKPHQDAHYTLQQLFDLQANADAGPLEESGSRLYLDLNRYLELTVNN
ncbi:COP23 domain-containing protein [Lyngbya sp. CCY1209]|jgi:hypothetical protein|uniref:COP23 domain-containing protein n=1 Tax=Lyngbya sp. CCY1209 TaxID=2886103 RepID=UPI002D2123B3|nr:COP23 domain-containing protein [Lyngbya sp. CCY1209]MEB3886908.1 COP23 domain-containing protein [Lyngbya sp. CCY1209]